MKIFKFGGASVKDAKGVKNLAAIIKNSSRPLVVVVSAMGKMTNAFELLFQRYFKKDESKWEQFELIKNYHTEIIGKLFPPEHPVHEDISSVFHLITNRLKRTPSINYDFEYDQLVCYGEILSTKIVSHYLQHEGIDNRWMDVRFLIKTDDQWRSANIDWPLTEVMIKDSLTLKDTSLYIIQGFLGATSADLTTTLGREGSDYTAAILGKVLHAEEVVVWKDVPGILNADPQYFPNPKKIDYMSYNEAVELTFFGAKVIHPKTIKPLENSGIPLHVRSFLNPKSGGTVIGPAEENQKGQRLPVFILKVRQVLITVSQPDFSFMNEESMSWVFGIFHQLNMKINMMQHSALKLTVAIDIPEHGIMELIDRLAEQFEIRYNDGLELITIRYYNSKAIEEVIGNRTVYVEQKTRRIARYLVRQERK